MKLAQRDLDLMPFSIRPYKSAADFDALYGLWQSTLAASWPMTPDYLRHLMTGSPQYREGNHFVAEQDGQIVGFVATQHNGKSGGIPLLLVRPDQQRQGIGRQLHSAAIDHLRGKGVEKISLAHGGGDYFWPGVPLNLPGAVDFFKACGWDFIYTSYDMTQNLTSYRTPPAIMERITRLGIDIRLAASQEDTTAVIAFEGRMFPSWVDYYRMNVDNFDSMLIAWDGQTVVGALLLNTADVDDMDNDSVWHLILGENMGTIGAVGVDETRQGQGIGLAMVAAASEILRDRGVHQCLIGWTDLLDFYGKVGYRQWRAYAMTD